MGSVHLLLFVDFLPECPSDILAYICHVFPWFPRFLHVSSVCFFYIDFLFFIFGKLFFIPSHGMPKSSLTPQCGFACWAPHVWDFLIFDIWWQYWPWILTFCCHTFPNFWFHFHCAWFHSIALYRLFLTIPFHPDCSYCLIAYLILASQSSVSPL